MARTKRSRTKGKGGQDPYWYINEDVRGRRAPRKRFCIKCRGISASETCCSTLTKTLPYTAHVPRKKASKARWEEFFRAFPNLRDPNEPR